MRRWLSLLLPAALLLSLAACGGETAPEEAPVPPAEPEAAEPAETMENSAADTGSGILVAYFSWADNAVLAEDVDVVTSPSVVAPGNVQQLAGWVREETGGDLFPIRVTDPYPSDWDDCLARANEERGADARPDLMENVEDLDQYGTVFLGYPNWWYGVPMALLTFLEQNDLSGKDVYLFCSHGTGGLARSVELITEAAPEANISDSIFDCYEEDAASSEADIKAWVHELGFGPADNTEQAQTARQIQVQSDGGTVVYQLNDSAAADALLAQLPLTVEVEDYSTNEKIFYPPQALDTADAPPAEGGTGTLAYYAPWGDVVMFYGDYNASSSLYELGQVVSGGGAGGQPVRDNHLNSCIINLKRSGGIDNEQNLSCVFLRQRHHQAGRGEPGGCHRGGPVRDPAGDPLYGGGSELAGPPLPQLRGDE